ncbi:hypothetical protein BpHYR1_043569 [Brachionus plicatilis]|uniref:MULE domain-containing protein n=1 Tax=Brachionus plicatilis TaxID=10195 RepID=A0A3M7SN10_BRAPC|nr:hypothetical protein BpHYR1_043569 [Brachionus plicatilis]
MFIMLFKNNHQNNLLLFQCLFEQTLRLDTEKQNSNSERHEPRFSTSLWSLFDRIKLNLPRTNNHVESWHRHIQLDTIKHLTVPKVVELFRREQNKVYSDKLRIKNGEQFKQKKDKHETNLRILRLVTDYKSEDIEAFLKGLDCLLIVNFILSNKKSFSIFCLSIFYHTAKFTNIYNYFSIYHANKTK